VKIQQSICTPNDPSSKDFSADEEVDRGATVYTKSIAGGSSDRDSWVCVPWFRPELPGL